MTTTAESTERSGRSTLTTVKHGLALSPELRRGLWGTIAIAVIATAGRVVESTYSPPTYTSAGPGSMGAGSGFFTCACR